MTEYNLSFKLTNDNTKMESDENLEFCVDAVWDHIQPFAKQKGSMTEQQYRDKMVKMRLQILGMIEKKKKPPPDCIIVRVYNPDGTPFTMPSTSKPSTSGSKDPTDNTNAEKQKIIDQNKFFKDSAGQCFDIYTTPKNYVGKQEDLRHLYRLLFWLDFVTQGFNCDKRYLSYF